MLQEARESCGTEGLQELHLLSPVFFLTPPSIPHQLGVGAQGFPTRESCWLVGILSSSTEEQSVARDGPCKV